MDRPKVLAANSGPRLAGRRAFQAGFTLLEVLIAVAVIGLLASVAIVNYPRSTASAEVAAANSELQNVHSGVLAYYGAKQSWPTSTAQDDFKDGRYLTGELRARYFIDEDSGSIASVDRTGVTSPWSSGIQFNPSTGRWEMAP